MASRVNTSAREKKRIKANAEKAYRIADEFFPGEVWTEIEERIFLSPRRPVGKKTNFKEELIDSRILRDSGSTIYLLPERRSSPEKKYDAIVDGEKTEFKNVGGNANTLITHFLKSRSQAPNVFINLEKSSLSRKEIINALYGARNSKTHIDKHGTIIKGYDDNNSFEGGKILLKIKGNNRLISLNVDNLKIE